MSEPPRQRLNAIDVARGVALVAMAGYHFTWDLSYFGVIPASTPFTTPMRVASHTIGSAFLALAGVSLALAHARGWNGRGYLMRLARIGVAAALVTGATYVVAPETPIGFGILHCIFVGSLLAAPFLIGVRPSGTYPRPYPLPASGEREFGARANDPTLRRVPVVNRTLRACLAVALGFGLIVLPRFVSSPLFDPLWLVWLGLGDQEPATLDWRPLAPWGGVLLIGLGAAAMLAPALPFAGWRAKAAPARALDFAGRHSLAIYLIHQPVLLGLLYGATEFSGFNQRQSVDAYLQACRPACVEAGGGIEACDRACACVVRDASGAGLAGRLGAHALSKQERGRIGAIVETCGSQAR